MRLKWRRAAWLRAFLGLAGVAFGYVAFVYLTLPDVRPLAATPPKTTAFIELRKAEARAAGTRNFRIRQQWVPYRRISAHLKRAVLVAEDSAFYDHEGLDYRQIKESIELNLEEGRLVRGASTITQQLAKNLYLSPSRNPIRKYKEVIITRRLEVALTKQRILELYLNLIEWGDGIFGCEAASRAYFGKSASALSPDEAALLAAAIINPRVYSPARPSARLRRRQQLIARRMGAVAPPSDASAPAAADPRGSTPNTPNSESNEGSIPARPVQPPPATGEVKPPYGLS